MIEHDVNISLLILIFGLIIILTMLIRRGSKSIKLPSLVGFLLLGFALKLTNGQYHFMTHSFKSIFEFLAKLGVIVLLFKIGLESDIKGLFNQLNKASVVWIGNIVISAMLGYLACIHILDLTNIQSIFVAIALTATSVGVPVSTWKESGALKSKSGELLIDVAEMDDITGIVLMALLFAIAPALRNGSDFTAVSALGFSALRILGMIVLFGLTCFVFSLFLERRLTAFLYKIESNAGVMLMVIGIGFIFAAAAGLLGFSVAIGAFFAGLAFSRDPNSEKIDTAFEPVYDLFTPFFFIGIGLSIAPSALSTGLSLGVILLLAAVTGKLTGAGLTSLPFLGGTGAALIAVSMVPRAEIAMIVMQHGANLGDWAVPSGVFAGMVFVVTITCIVFPIIIRSMLMKWPQRG